MSKEEVVEACGELIEEMKEMPDKRWRPKGWENPYAPKVKSAQIRTHSQEVYEAGADAMLVGVLEHLEDSVFFVDTRGYIALKPNATMNWQTLKEEAGVHKG